MFTSHCFSFFLFCSCSCSTELDYTHKATFRTIHKSHRLTHSPFWMWAEVWSWTFCSDDLMLSKSCWSCSWVKHTKLSFTVFLMTLDVSLVDLVLLSDCTLTTPMTLQRSILLLVLVFLLPFSAWFTPSVPLHFLSLCHLSSSLGPGLGVGAVFCSLFFWVTWWQRQTLFRLHEFGKDVLKVSIGINLQEEKKKI